MRQPLGYRRRVLWLLSLLSVCGAMAVTTMAAEERTKISKVRLEFTSDIIPGESGGDVEIAVAEGDENYYVSSWELLNVTEDNWNELEPPIVRVEINTDGEEYYFSNTSASGFELILPSDNIFRRVEFEKASRKDNKSSLILTVKMRFRLGEGGAETVYNPKKLKWEETSDGTASSIGSWEKAIGAASYQVQLEKDGVLLDKILTVHQLSHDFSSQITEPGIYRFWVRAVNEYKARGKWVKSNKRVISQEQLNQLGPGWRKTEDGTRWWWSNGDGTWALTQWKEIEGQWYYFDQDGYMATGWIAVEGKEYYLNPESGAMCRSMVTPDGFTVGADGAKMNIEAAEQEGRER